jgi:hypothetical protein
LLVFSAGKELWKGISSRHAARERLAKGKSSAYRSVRVDRIIAIDKVQSIQFLVREFVRVGIGYILARQLVLAHCIGDAAFQIRTRPPGAVVESKDFNCGFVFAI